MIRKLTFVALISIFSCNSIFAAANLNTGFGPLTPKDVGGNGECWFLSVADQLGRVGMNVSHTEVRRVTEANIERRITNIIGHFDPDRAENQILDRDDMRDYYAKGGQGSTLNNVALADIYNVNVHLYNEMHHVQNFIAQPPVDRHIYIGYMGNGAGGHYVSLIAPENFIPPHDHPIDPDELLHILQPSVIDFFPQEKIFKILPDYYAHDGVQTFSANIVDRLSKRNRVHSQDDQDANNFWLAGNWTKNKQYAAQNKNTYDSTGYNVSFGYDLKITDSFVIGGAGGFSQEDVSYSASNETLDMQSYSGSIYSQYQPGNLKLSAAVIGGTNAAEANRTDIYENDNRNRNRNICGNISAYFASLLGQVSYDFKYGASILTPAVKGQYSMFWQDEYNDEGTLNIKNYLERKYSFLNLDYSIKYTYQFSAAENLHIMPSMQIGLMQNKRLKADDMKYTIEDYTALPITIETDFSAIENIYYICPALAVKSNILTGMVYYKRSQGKGAFVSNVFGLNLSAKF